MVRVWYTVLVHTFCFIGNKENCIRSTRTFGAGMTSILVRTRSGLNALNCLNTLNWLNQQPNHSIGLTLRSLRVPSCHQYLLSWTLFPNKGSLRLSPSEAPSPSLSLSLPLSETSSLSLSLSLSLHPRALSTRPVWSPQPGFNLHWCLRRWCTQGVTTLFFDSERPGVPSCFPERLSTP